MYHHRSPVAKQPVEHIADCEVWEVRDNIVYPIAAGLYQGSIGSAVKFDICDIVLLGRLGGFWRGQKWQSQACLN